MTSTSNDYYNEESQLRRTVKRLIEDGKLAELKKCRTLTPACPHNKYGPLDPLGHAINYSNGDITDIIKYLVEDLKIKSEPALSRALDYGFLDIAKYLKDKGYTIKYTDRNYVCSVPAMNFALEWGLSFNEYAVRDICFIQNGKDVYERIKHLFDVCKHQCPVTAADFEQVCDDKVFSFLIDNTNVELDTVMTFAVKNFCFESIQNLIGRGIEFKAEHLHAIMLSCDFEHVDKLRARFDIELIDLLEYVFTSLEDDDDTVALINRYHSLLGDQFVEWVRNNNLMHKVCEAYHVAAFELLVKMGIQITEQDVYDIHNNELSTLDRGDNLVEKLSFSLLLVNKCNDAIEILRDIIENEMEFSDDSVVDTFKRFEALYGRETFAKYVKMLKLDEKYANYDAEREEDLKADGETTSDPSVSEYFKLLFRKK